MNRNIKSSTSSTMTYTGIVTLSQYIKGKRFTVASAHNAGGRPLFNFLADCLAGDYDIAKLDIPKKILLLNLTVDENGDRSLARANNTGFITILSKPEKVYSTTEGIIRYSFIIPQDIFTGTSFNAIGLYPASAIETDVDDYAAYCEIDLGNASISASSVLVLDWELHISN